MTKREREGREVAKDTRATSRGGVRAHKKSGGKWDYDIDDGKLFPREVSELVSVNLPHMYAA